MQDKKEVLFFIDSQLQIAKTIMDNCAKLAEEHGVIFSLPWGGEGSYQRGMGADYVPDTAPDQEKRWYDQTGWIPSAGSC